MMLRFYLYIDPGTGSVILQALVATVVGALVAVKIYWHRLLGFFGMSRKKKSDNDSEPDDSGKSDDPQG